MQNKKFAFVALLSASVFVLPQCTKDDPRPHTPVTYPAVEAAFGSNIDLNNLANYAEQTIPAYILKDNTGGNTITNAKATLGRVLFYDKNLSIDNSIACASCHKQQFAFGDTSLVSNGVSGATTKRHSMRLINTRFAVENKFFWDERTSTLEQTTTQPIQDHAEMGYSGQHGRPDLNTLLAKLQATDYYQELFNFVYGDGMVSEARMQECLAQFIRSIQSFDSKYDAGRAKVSNDWQDFPNFTAQENLGKYLYTIMPYSDYNGNRTSGGLGCNDCHKAPEFDIRPNIGNNGIISKHNAAGFDLANTRAPSLRNLTNSTGNPNTVMMHTGEMTTLQEVIEHYGNIPAEANNTNLDPRFKWNGAGQKLHLDQSEVDAVIAFLQTLSGTSVYTDAKWANPFR
jgi:cytochrome c peroxidase